MLLKSDIVSSKEEKTYIFNSKKNVCFVDMRSWKVGIEKIRVFIPNIQKSILTFNFFLYGSLEVSSMKENNEDRELRITV